MKSFYRRQVTLIGAVLFVALLLSGLGSMALTYRYVLRDKKDTMEHNASYIASFTSDYLSTMKVGINHPAYQRYIASVADISDSTVILAENSGEIVYASSGGNAGKNSVLQGTIPPYVADTIAREGEYSGRTNLGGLVTDGSLVIAVPIRQSSFVTGLTVQRGIVVVAGGMGKLAEMRKNLAFILLLSALSAFCIVYIISSVTAKKQTKPLKEIASAARKFGAGDFSARVTGYEKREDEVGELAEAFNSMAESLAEIEAQNSEFISNVSHELKTPMTTIAGFAEGILDGTIPPNKEESALKTISSETRRLSRLVHRMLDIARLPSNKTVLAQEKFDIEELFLRVLLSLEGRINEHKLDVETDFPDGVVTVWGDPDAITQVCYNLLDNAVKFATPGSTLCLGIRIKGEKAYISVRNRGETISPEEQKLIFERFHKSDPSRSEDRDGVGLGLYIVKDLIARHNESITVESADGLTTFTFTLTMA